MITPNTLSSDIQVKYDFFSEKYHWYQAAKQAQCEGNHVIPL